MQAASCWHALCVQFSLDGYYPATAQMLTSRKRCQLQGLPPELLFPPGRLLPPPQPPPLVPSLPPAPAACAAQRRGAARKRAGGSRRGRPQGTALLVWTSPFGLACDARCTANGQKSLLFLALSAPGCACACALSWMQAFMPERLTEAACDSLIITNKAVAVATCHLVQCGGLGPFRSRWS